MAHISRRLKYSFDGALAGGGDPASSLLYVFGPGMTGWAAAKRTLRTQGSRLSFDRVLGLFAHPACKAPGASPWRTDSRAGVFENA